MLFTVAKIYGFQPVTIITKSATLDVAAALDPPLIITYSFEQILFRNLLFH